MQKEFKSADQDGVSKDMAKVLKRYCKMEVQFGQMEKWIKKNMEALHAENGKRIKERLDECLEDNEKRMQEHEEKVQGQADHILPSARHIEQAAQKAVDAHAVVLGVTINEQGYFVRMTVRTPFCLIWLYYKLYNVANALTKIANERHAG